MRTSAMNACSTCAGCLAWLCGTLPVGAFSLPVTVSESNPCTLRKRAEGWSLARLRKVQRSEEHTSELHSLGHLVCRLLLVIKKLSMVLFWYIHVRLDNLGAL